QTSDAATGRRVVPGVNKTHTPVFVPCCVPADRSGCQIHMDVRLQLGVIDVELLDEAALVSKGHAELPEVEVRVVLHDVPDDRHPSDLDHCLWSYLGLFDQPCAVPAGENDDLHARPLSSARTRSP